MNESLKATGRVDLRQVRNGQVISEISDHNTIVTLGMSQIAMRIISGTYAQPDPFKWMSIGLGSDTILPADTTLGSEYIKYGLGSITGSTTTTATTNDTSRWIGSFGMTDTKTINEAGLFNKSGLNLGSMLSRTCFADIAAVSGDRIIVDWKVSFASA